MDQKRPRLGKILCSCRCTPPLDLSENVWHRIVLRETRVTRLKLWFFSALGFVSLISLLPMWKTLVGDFAQSGFYNYLSLLFSDGKSVASYWKEFTFSLAESLPILSIVLSMTLVLILFLSIKYGVRQIIKNQLSFSITA